VINPNLIDYHEEYTNKNIQNQVIYPILLS